MSISPSSSARSISMTKTPRPPISARDAEVRSPEVVIVWTSKVASGFAERSALSAISVWAQREAAAAGAYLEGARHNGALLGPDAPGVR